MLLLQVLLPLLLLLLLPSTMSFRRGFSISSGSSSSSSSSNTVIKGATLSKKSAISQYGVTEEDLTELPCKWRSCHGNPFPLFERSAVEQLVAKKKGSDPAFAAAAKASDDAKAARAAKAALAQADAEVAKIETAMKTGGGQVPREGTMPKTAAKRVYCLADEDLAGLPKTYGRGMFGNSSENYECSLLLAAAEQKYGGAAGLLERRRAFVKRTTAKVLKEWQAKKTHAQQIVNRIEGPMRQQPAVQQQDGGRKSMMQVMEALRLRSSPVSVAAVAASDDDYLGSHTVQQLKVLCKDAGLPKTGKKDDLKNRIYDHNRKKRKHDAQ